MPSGIDPNALYQQQLAQELLKQSRQGPQPLRRGMPTFSENMQNIRAANSGPITMGGVGRSVLGALRGAAAPIGLATLTGGVGQTVAKSYGDMLVEDEAAKPPIQPGRRNTYLPQELESMQGQPQLQQVRPNVNEVGYVPDELQDMTAIATEPEVEEIPPEMLVEAQDTRLEDLLDKPDRPAPRVEEMPNSRLALETLSTNKVGQAPVRRETPKRGLFGHLGEFLRTGGRNRERDDYNAELETYLKANSFTDPEKLAAGVAQQDVMGARDKNFQAELAKYSGEGMSQQDKYRADMLGAERKASMMEGINKNKAALEHGYRMEEIGASAANQKLSPEAAKIQAAYKIMTEYPDIFTPEQIATVTGVMPTQEGLSAVSKGRQRDDGSAKMMQTLTLLEALKSGRTPTTAKDTKAEAKKKVEIKDTSMLKKKDE